VPEGERPVVAGHSLGGMTIVAWAQAQHGGVSDRIAGAALVCTGMGDLISESLILRAPPGLGRVHAAAGRVMLSASAPLPKGSTPISHRAVKYVALSPGASPARVAFCEELVLDCRRDVRAATGGTLTRLDLMDGLASLDVPTLVIAGGRDRLTPPVHAERMAAALPCLERVVEVPGAGHMSPVEAPEIVTRELRALVLSATRPDAAAAPARDAGPPGRSAR
jgi:pimeloyl-ACP methyl ester carboxylesterase